MKDETDFSAWLQAELDKRGWNQSDLARRSGISTGVISRVLNRERNIGPEVGVRLSEALLLPPENVFRIAGLLPRRRVTAQVEEQCELAQHYLRQMDESTREVMLVCMRALALQTREEVYLASSPAVPTASWVTSTAGYFGEQDTRRWVRSVKAMIETGNGLPDNTFHATVYDPLFDPLPQGFSACYPGDGGQDSEPDLIVVLDPEGGSRVCVVVQTERAADRRDSLKARMRRDLANYQGHFDGIYYIAKARDAARRLETALKTLKYDAKPHPEADRQPLEIAPGLIAIFQEADLKSTWLPSPSQIDRCRRHPPPDKPNMARVYHYYKHKVREREGA